MGNSIPYCYGSDNRYLFHWYVVLLDGSVTWWHSPENVIPERRAHAIGLVGIFVVVKAVVLPKIFETLRGLRYMGGAVQKGIQQVTQKETRKKSPGIVADPKQGENPVKDQEKKRSHDQSRDGRHQQPFCVPRIQVM